MKSLLTRFSALITAVMTTRTPHLVMFGISILAGILYLLWTKSMLLYFLFITMLLIFGFRPPARWLNDVKAAWGTRPWAKITDSPPDDGAHVDVKEGEYQPAK